ncbi:hypothetical protein MMC09_005802 [Bachmanniomyces sp. S44760]|nr:hypothetical protein [Bachmanniomyces sp. S44760]
MRGNHHNHNKNNNGPQGLTNSTNHHHQHQHQNQQTNSATPHPSIEWPSLNSMLGTKHAMRSRLRSREVSVRKQVGDAAGMVNEDEGETTRRGEDKSV